MRAPTDRENWNQVVTGASPPDHIVQLYQDQGFLNRAVCRFAGAAVANGEGIILAPTLTHWNAFRPHLEAEGVDVEAAQRREQLVVVDADELLPRFMRDGMPDAPVFLGLAGNVIEKARAGGRYEKVRWWGEMVNVLWERGDFAASMALEDLFDQLGRKRDIALFCSFRMDNFDGAVHTYMLPRLGTNHSHLVPVEDYARLEEAVAEALRETVGADEARVVEERLVSDYRPPLSMPRAQMLLLGLRQMLPTVADTVLQRSRKLYAASGPRMTSQRIARPRNWSGLRGAEGDDAFASTAAMELMSILDTVEVPILVVGRDYRMACFNRAAADRLDISPSDVGRACHQISGLAGLPQLEAHCAEVLASGVERRADLRDGDRWFAVRMSAYTRADGQIGGTVMTFTNVTAFRASVALAVFERESIMAILDTVADPLVVLSADERIQSGNRAFYATFGISRDRAQGLRLYELGSGALERAILRTQLKELLAGSLRFHPVEVDHVLTAEGERTLLLDARPLSIPGHSERRVLVSFQDITARRQAEAAKDLRSEEELRRSEAFLAEAQRLSSTGSFAWKVANDYITWSEQLYQTFEFERDLPVTLERIRARVHPEDLAQFNGLVERSRGTGRDFDYEFRLLMPNQSVKYIHVIAHAIRDASGETEYIGAAQDATQRRMAEAALAKARSELTHVSRVSSLGVMTASIAHEVNQPLSGIITNAGTCLHMLAADPPDLDGARETARRTIRDAQRASDVLSRIRGLVTKKALAAERVDLNEAAREVIALSMGELQRGRVVVRCVLADHLPSVVGDRVQLQQVILNLVLNAIEAMSIVEARPRELEVRTEPEGGGVRLSVQDTGVGLAPMAVERLFEPFYTTKSGGMGIGLSISRSIIESHRGRLGATRSTGPGATFWFSLPSEGDGSRDTPS